MDSDFMANVIATAAANLRATAIVDGYQPLKNLLAWKFGAGSGVMQAITSLEAKPDSMGRQTTLQEELAAVNAPQDAEVLAATKQLQQTFINNGIPFGPHRRVESGPFSVGRDKLQQTQSEPGSVQALIGMILGIVAVIICIVPAFGATTALAGIVVSALGRQSVSRKGMATTGLALSIVAFIVGVAVLVLISQHP